MDAQDRIPPSGDSSGQSTSAICRTAGVYITGNSSIHGAISKSEAGEGARPTREVIRAITVALGGQGKTDVGKKEAGTTVSWDKMNRAVRVNKFTR